MKKIILSKESNALNIHNTFGSHMLNQKFNIVMPLGDDCGCAGYLKDHKLRRYSYPFDWLFNISFENRIKLIENHFKDFLVKSNLRGLEKSKDAILRDDNCDYYEDIKYGTQFLHDFVQGLDFKESFDNVKQKYDRRIQRFYENIEKAKKALFIWRSKYTILSDKQISDAYNRICKVFPKTEIFFLIIENNEEAKENIFQNQLQKNILKVSAQLTIANATDAFTLAKGNRKINNMIFSQIKITRDSFILKTWLMKRWIEIFCIFIKPRDKRKKIRFYLKSMLLE